MQPVRVKAYGLVPITRTVYLSIQAVGAVVLAALYLTADRLPIPTQYQAYWRWLILLIVGLEVVETTVMLWRFSAAERAARGAGTPPPLPAGRRHAP